jgi:hypothetical protein
MLALCAGMCIRELLALLKNSGGEELTAPLILRRAGSRESLRVEHGRETEPSEPKVEDPTSTSIWISRRREQVNAQGELLILAEAPSNALS